MGVLLWLQLVIAVTTMTVAFFATTSEAVGVYKAFVGPAGVGKSYLISLYGCPRQQCDTRASCTQRAAHCADFLDTVGLNHDAATTEILYKGQKRYLSGIYFPMYNFFELLEDKKITDIELYYVELAANPRTGFTGKSFEQIARDDLKCPVTRIINRMYPDDWKAQQNVGPNDIVIPAYADTQKGYVPPPLKGTPCRLALASDWREKMLNNDLEGIRSGIIIQECEDARTLLASYEEILRRSPQAVDDRSCQKITGYMPIPESGFATPTAPQGNRGHVRYQNEGDAGRIEVDIHLGGNAAGGGRSGGGQPIYGVDEDCTNRRAQRNDAIAKENAHLFALQQTALAEKHKAQEQLRKCSMLANWQ